ncbi:hypothetical protein [Porcipelethomonas sp.]|uniref:hypothetical protein n=1 Tax=Porcipelethomonas sp. TaxID=2981675 RepID=UPI003EF45EBA
MTKAEIKFAEFIRKHIVTIGFAAAALMAVILRILMLDHETSDYSFFMKNWIIQLAQYDGLSGLGENIGEYNVPYMLFLALLPYLPFDDLTEIKILSIIFDFVGAFAAIKVVSMITRKKFFSAFNLALFSVIIFCPVVFINSAFWAQCDFIYVSMILFCMYFMMKEKYGCAMIFYGIAFVLKLQAIFFLPVILIYYFASKKMSALNLLYIIPVYFIGILPAIIAGRGFKDTLTIYFKQTDIYEQLTMACPNIFNFITGDYEMFKKVGIILTITVLGLGACAFIYQRKDVSGSDLVLLSFWVTYVCIFFLPAMHERYTFITCILSILWAFIYKKDWWIALAVNAVSFLSYTPYLFQNTVIDLNYLAVANLILLVLVSRRLFVKTPSDALLKNS